MACAWYEELFASLACSAVDAQNKVNGQDNGLLGSAFSSIVGGIVNWLTDQISRAVTWTLKTLSTFWVNLPTPDTADASGVNPSSTIAWMWNHLGYFTMLLLLLSILLGAGRMMWSQRADPGVDTVKAVLRYVVVTSMGIGVTTLMIQASDEFSPWIIQQATGKDFGQAISTLLNVDGITSAVLGLVLVIIFGLIAVLTSLIQVILMVIRMTMLVLLTSVQPLAASITNTEMGMQWFKKMIAWTVAFILYKPVAAIIYALSFRLITDTVSGDDASLLNLIMGMTMLVMAVLALPALMRFLVPAVTAVAGGAGAGAMIAGAVATGAVLAATGGAGAVGGASGAASSASSASPKGGGSAAAGPGGAASGGGGSACGSLTAGSTSTWAGPEASGAAGSGIAAESTVRASAGDPGGSGPPPAAATGPGPASSGSSGAGADVGSAAAHPGATTAAGSTGTSPGRGPRRAAQVTRSSPHRGTGRPRTRPAVSLPTPDADAGGNDGSGSGDPGG